MKKAAEQLHFRQFLGVTGELQGATIDWEGESPDFLVTLSDRIIGVELTEHFHGRASKGGIGQRQREVFERAVVADAQRLFEANAGPPLYVSVAWYGRVV